MNVLLGFNAFVFSFAYFSAMLWCKRKVLSSTACFIKPYRDRGYQIRWISGRFCAMGDSLKSYLDTSGKEVPGRPKNIDDIINRIR